MADWKPLNPDLYNSLLNNFGDVKVDKPGETMLWRPEWNGARMSVKVDYGGETYRVNCPWCGDAKYHLYINYAFGTIIDNSEDMVDAGAAATVRQGEPINRSKPDLAADLAAGKASIVQADQAAICLAVVKQENAYFSQKIFYGHCYKHGEIDSFQRGVILKGWGTFRPKDIRVCTSQNGTVQADLYQSPGECAVLSTSDFRTRAGCSYLDNRGIDPDYMGSVYGWMLCLIGSPTVWGGGCAGRLIVPVTRDGQVVGWQARLAFDPPPELKDKDFANRRWLTMPGAGWRSRNLIGYDQAKQSRYCILVEGPTDMARQGPPCVGSLGMTMSHHQYELIAQTWGDRPDKAVIVMGDSGTKEDAVVRKTVSELRRRCVAPVYAPRLPHGDPGSWAKADFFNFITDYVRKNPDGVQYGENKESFPAIQ